MTFNCFWCDPPLIIQSKLLLQIHCEENHTESEWYHIKKRHEKK